MGRKKKYNSEDELKDAKRKQSREYYYRNKDKINAHRMKIYYDKINAHRMKIYYDKKTTK